MADDPAPTTDPAGLSRTPDGTLASPTPSPDSGQSPSGTPTPQPDGATLLNQQSTEAGAEGEGGESKPDKASKGAPETYADFKVPDGYTLDPEIKGEVEGLFKGMNLSQADAQKLVDFYTKQTQEAMDAPYRVYREMTDGWRRDAEAHPDLKGKLGPGQEINVRIGRFLSALPDQKLASDFRSLMDLTGAGNHPAFIRVIDHLAKAVSEGTHVNGRGPSPGGQSEPGKGGEPNAAQALWPNLPSSSR